MTRGPRGACWAALGLAACVAAAFAPALLGAGVFYERDVLNYWYPHVTVLRRAFAEGSWPLWNPWVGFGTPYLADGSFQLAYPPTWLVLVLPPAVQFTLFAVGHALLAALGACALARRLGLAWLAASVAGVSYALSGPLLSAVNLFHHYAGAAWLPWLLWAFIGHLRRPNGASALRLGALGGVQLLAASGDMLLCAGLLGLLLGGWELLRSRPAGSTLATSAGGLALAAALALAIGAVQWLPTAERAASGFRARQDPRTSTSWSLHPLSLADLAVPRLVSELPLTTPWRGRLFEGREPLLSCLYLGVVPLALALLALRSGHPLVPPAAAGVAFFLTASLGRHTPFYSLLLPLPGFSLLRYPPKFLLPCALCVALLAGAGAQAWARDWNREGRRRALATALALALGAVGLVAGGAWAAPAVLAALVPAGELDAAAHRALLLLARTAVLALIAAVLLARRRQTSEATPIATRLLLLTGALDLASVAHATLRLAPEELAAHRPAVVGHAGVTPGSRIHSSSESAECRALAGGAASWPPAWRAALAFQDTLQPPTNARWGVFGSFDGEFTGLGSPWSAAFTSLVQADLAGAGAQRLLRLSGVAHVLWLGRSGVPGLEPVAALPVGFACPLQVLRVPEPLPRARLVHDARHASGIEATLATLLDASLDPERTVVLEGESEPAGARAADGVASPAENGGNEGVQFLARSLDTLDLAVRLRAAGWLVVSEAFDPGWRATVDGVAAPVLRADGLFRAVRLTEGTHRVRLAYRPWAATLGGWLSLAGLLGTAVAWLALRRSAAGEAGLPPSAAEGSIAAGTGRA